MQGRRIHFYAIAVFLFVGMTCKDSSVQPEVDNNLLANGSFESDHTPTLQGWRLGNPRLAQLINEAPPKGGSWSLKLTSDWAPTTGFVYISVANVSSGDIVTLSAFVRGTCKFGGRGIIELAVGPAMYTQHKKSASSSDTVWNQISVTDTIALAPNDTVWVVLSSPITEMVPFQQMFDLVKLEKALQ